MTARYIISDVFDGIASLEDGSIDLVVSSPPFLALRSYLPADHPDKGKEIGSEPTPEAFIDTLLDVVEAVTPKLAPHGTLCFELGDTYAGSGGAGGDYNADGLRAGQQAFSGSAHKRALAGIGDDYRPARSGRDVDAWPLAKSLCLIPESFRWALVYGRNPFNGRETPRWRARNVIRWCRPNPPVGALGDKFRPATSDMVVVCKSARRWFDLDAVRIPYEGAPPVGGSASRQPVAGEEQTNGRQGLQRAALAPASNPAGAPPLDWWAIPTEPYKGSHYATWPRRLLDKPILAMCPRKVCTVCGKPSERITEPSGEQGEWRETDDRPGWTDAENGSRLKMPSGPSGFTSQFTTLGWTDCGHDSWRVGTILDPFGGSGTTAQVAIAHGRDAVLIDLDERNALLAEERCGMFLTVERLADERAS